MTLVFFICKININTCPVSSTIFFTRIRVGQSVKLLKRTMGELQNISHGVSFGLLPQKH